MILKSAKQGLSTVLIVGTSQPSTDEHFGVLIENFTIAENSGGLGAIEVIGLPLVLIRDNVFRDNRGPSIFATALPGRDLSARFIGHVSICRNLFNGSGVDVMPAEKQFVIVMGNAFRNAGIDIEYSKALVPWDDPRRRWPQPYARVYIYKNTIQADRYLGWGISLSDAEDVAIQENTIEGADFDGVSLIGESEAVIIGNRIRGNRKTGVSIGEGRALLKGNRIEGNGDPSLVYTGGVLIGSLAQVELEGNEIVENLSWGIITTNTASVVACRGNRVSGNRLGDYGWYSINPPIEPQPSPDLKAKCEGN